MAAGGMFAWRTSGKPTVSLTQLTVHELNVRRQEFKILDVRQPGEWSEGHIDGAIFITGAELPERIDEVPERGPLAVICGSGFRSSSAASLLKHHGRDESSQSSVGAALGTPPDTRRSHDIARRTPENRRCRSCRRRRHGDNTAFHLAKMGMTDVVLLEKESTLGAMSTGQCAGGIRHQFSSETNVKLSIESIKMSRRSPRRRAKTSASGSPATYSS